MFCNNNLIAKWGVYNASQSNIYGVNLNCTCYYNEIVCKEIQSSHEIHECIY